MRYDIQFKLLVVEDDLTGHEGYKIVGTRHGIRWETVRKWVRSYRAQGKAGLQRKYERYSAAFKQAIVQRMYDEGLSCQEAVALFNIRSASAIGDWKRLAQTKGNPLVSSAHEKLQNTPREELGVADSLPDDVPDDRKILVKEINRLRMEVAYLKKLGALVHANKRSAREKKR